MGAIVKVVSFHSGVLSLEDEAGWGRESFDKDGHYKIVHGEASPTGEASGDGMGAYLIENAFVQALVAQHD